LIESQMQEMVLPDGRRLAFAEYGDLEGSPVFFFHGIPGSRIFRPPDAITAALGVRLVCVDRPGYGDSSFQPNRRILDWPADITALADYLGMPWFAVAGHSGGGPYVAACAYALPDRVQGAVIISGIGPLGAPGVTRGMGSRNRMGFWVGRWAPWWYWRLLNWLFYRSAHRHPESLFPDDLSGGVPADQAVLMDPDVLQLCRTSVREGFRQGITGHAWEGRLLSHPWGFDLGRITVLVHLWHGESDLDTPVQMGRFMASAIPNCEATFIPSAGHMLIFPHWEMILGSLLATLQL